MACDDSGVLRVESDEGRRAGRRVPVLAQCTGRVSFRVWLRGRDYAYVKEKSLVISWEPAAERT